MSFVTVQATGNSQTSINLDHVVRVETHRGIDQVTVHFLSGPPLTFSRSAASDLLEAVDASHSWEPAEAH